MNMDFGYTMFSSEKLNLKSYYILFENLFSHYHEKNMKILTKYSDENKFDVKFRINDKIYRFIAGTDIMLKHKLIIGFIICDKGTQEDCSNFISILNQFCDENNIILV